MDPLATSDKDNENESEEESYRDLNDTDFNRVDSGSTGEQAKLDVQLARSEEIIVVSDLYKKKP